MRFRLSFSRFGGKVAYERDPWFSFKLISRRTHVPAVTDSKKGRGVSRPFFFFSRVLTTIIFSIIFLLLYAVQNFFLQWRLPSLLGWLVASL